MVHSEALHTIDKLISAFRNAPYLCSTNIAWPINYEAINFTIDHQRCGYFGG